MRPTLKRHLVAAATTLALLGCDRPADSASTRSEPTPTAATYDPIAAAAPTRNDVAAAVYTWFSGFDHQLPVDFFVARLATGAPGFHMQYPGAEPISDESGFRKWYQGVVDGVHYNFHELVSLKVTPEVAPRWNGTALEWPSAPSPKWTVDLRVRWTVPGPTAAEGADLCIDQRWTLLETRGGTAGDPQFKTHTMTACVVPGTTGAGCGDGAPSCLPPS